MIRWYIITYQLALLLSHFVEWRNVLLFLIAFLLDGLRVRWQFVVGIRNLRMLSEACSSPIIWWGFPRPAPFPYTLINAGLVHHLSHHIYAILMHRLKLIGFSKGVSNSFSDDNESVAYHTRQAMSPSHPHIHVGSSKAEDEVHENYDNQEEPYGVQFVKNHCIHKGDFSSLLILNFG